MAVTDYDENLLGTERGEIRRFREQTRWALPIAAVLGGIGLAFGGAAFLLYKRGVIETPSGVGDFIAGTAGPLWALAGLLVIYIAFAGQRAGLVYQQAELRATRQEFAKQSAELAEQRHQMEVQNRQARRQTFDNAFFQMLRLHSEIVAQTDVRDTGVVQGGAELLRGRDAFAGLYARYRHRYHEVARSEAREEASDPALKGRSFASPQKHQEYIDERAAAIEGGRTSQEAIEVARAVYRDFYDGHQFEIGHYFRNLYHVVKFVDSADDEVVPDKKRYVSIIRAQLSSAELLLLFHNGLEQGRKKFKPLIERYALLKQFPKAEVIVEELVEEYFPSAFGVG